MFVTIHFVSSVHRRLVSGCGDQQNRHNIYIISKKHTTTNNNMVAHATLRIGLAIAVVACVLTAQFASATPRDYVLTCDSSGSTITASSATQCVYNPDKEVLVCGSDDSSGPRIAVWNPRTLVTTHIAGNGAEPR